jgi:predicted Zn-dependent peptidase
MLTIYAGTSGEQIGDLVDLTLQELRRSADDMSAAELERARAQMKAGLLMGLESPSARAERNARLVAIWDRIPPLEETVARIDAVNLQALRAHAGALTASGRSAMALYGPVTGAPDIHRIRERLAA